MRHAEQRALGGGGSARYELEIVRQTQQIIRRDFQGFGQGDECVDGGYLASNFKFPDRDICDTNQLTKGRFSQALDFPGLPQSFRKTFSPVHFQPLDISHRLIYPIPVT